MATLQSERNMYEAMFGEMSCPTEQTASVEELDEAIAECKAMLSYSIHLNDKREVAYWRKLLQENKTQRRKMVA